MWILPFNLSSSKNMFNCPCISLLCNIWGYKKHMIKKSVSNGFALGAIMWDNLDPLAGHFWPHVWYSVFFGTTAVLLLIVYSGDSTWAWRLQYFWFLCNNLNLTFFSIRQYHFATSGSGLKAYFIFQVPLHIAWLSVRIIEVFPADWGLRASDQLKHWWFLLRNWIPPPPKLYVLLTDN